MIQELEVFIACQHSYHFDANYIAKVGALWATKKK